MNERINMKQALIDAMVAYEMRKGRTNISKQTIANFGLFANKLTHPKNHESDNPIYQQRR
jgi:hypothetical protein